MPDRFDSREPVDNFDDLAYRNGEIARKGGKSLGDNPYMKSASRYRIWAAGWCDGDMQLAAHEGEER